MVEIAGYYRLEEAAERLGITRRRVQQLIKDRRQDYPKVGKTVLIPESEVERLAAEERKPGPKPGGSNDTN